MKNNNNYIIAGGTEGKKRLATLADVLYPYTQPLLQANGVAEGASFLDVGCGGGHVSMMAASMVGGSGNVTAIDFDKEIIESNRHEVIDQGINNLWFYTMSAYDLNYDNEFDVVYSRFLLSHLTEPLLVLKKIVQSVKKGGTVIIEDIDFSGHFCYPECVAFDEYVRLFTTAAKQRGHNPEIGPSLVSLFHEAGINQLHFDIIQPAFTKGDGKAMAYITMDKITDAILSQRLAKTPEINRIMKQLKAFTNDPTTMISLPRIFRVVGVK